MFSHILLLFFPLIITDSHSLNNDLYEYLLQRKNEDLWPVVYKRHFHLTRLLTFTVLQTNEHHLETRDFAEKVLHLLIRNDHAIKMQEKFLTNFTPKPKRETPAENKTGVRIKEDKCQGKDTFFKVKKTTTDFGEGYLLLAWDANILGEFLSRYHSLLIPKARSTYALFFCSSRMDSEVHSLLTHLWRVSKILNVIAQKDDQIYIYRPFVHTNTSWGVIDTYDILEVYQNPSLITNPITNLNKFSLRISLFEKNPTAIRKLPSILKTNPIYKNLSWSKGFAGSDALIVATLAEYLNFEPVIPKNLPPSSYGHMLPNGSSYGVLADILNNQSDYGANCRLMNYYKTDKIEFTVPYSSDKISFAVPKAEAVPRWRTLFTCFDKLSWIMIFAASIACACFWYYLRSSKHIVKSSWEMYSFLVGIPCKVVPSPDQLVFLSSCMMFNVIILGIIQGSLFTDFTKTSHYPDMNTLEDVVESGLPIMSFAWLIVTDNKSKLLTKLRENSIPFDKDRIDEIVRYRNMIALDRLLDIELNVKTKFMGPGGVPLLHVVEESLTSHLTTSIVPKSSPYLVVFNQVIRRLVEGGFIIKWYNDVVESLVIEHSSDIVEEEVLKPFGVEDVQAAFYVIVVGFSASVFVFLCEILAKLKGHGVDNKFYKLF